MTADTEESNNVEKPVGKGRPTPKRRDQEAARKRALVLDPKTDSKKRKELDRTRRESEYLALRQGDERNMPPEHKGPERRFIRDFVDSRTIMAEFLLPLSFLFVIISLFMNNNASAGALLILGFYSLVFAALIEMILMTRKLKKHFEQKYGENRLPRGWRFYAISRALNIRRFRLPRPKVKRGEYPS